MMHVLYLVVILLLSSAAGAGVPGLAAQDALPRPGARVRVSAPEVLPHRVAGRVVRITPDTVVLRTGSVEELAIPLAETVRMDRSLGRSHGWGAARGFAFGALAGGTAMGVAVLGGAELCIYISCLNNNLAGAAGGFLVGAGVGALPGAAIGGVLGVERWQTVAPVQLRALHVSPSGIVVSIAIP
jgi:hypothetical protein